ncbi:MAG: HipA N-terminal domain-containing protein [Bacteroidales bacterium]|nr:HipA N-terminal domain-containing protein [Bacteroidales bacterium]
MKKADIFIDGVFCGLLTEDNDGFHFRYDDHYLALENPCPLSPTMPLTSEEYEKEIMFPVFDGLIPEGWLLNIVTKSWKIDSRDRMSLLMECCRDSIGNISVRPHVQ